MVELETGNRFSGAKTKLNSQQPHKAGGRRPVAGCKVPFFTHQRLSTQFADDGDCFTPYLIHRFRNRPGRGGGGHGMGGHTTGEVVKVVPGGLGRCARTRR